MTLRVVTLPSILRIKKKNAYVSLIASSKYKKKLNKELL